MKKVINGKIYDTEKATEIHSYSFSNPRDFNYVNETLYQTPRSKVFFLAGEGGANTKYRVAVGQNEWSGGEKICPLTKEQALEWAETYMDGDDIERYFGDMIEDA